MMEQLPFSMEEYNERVRRIRERMSGRESGHTYADQAGQYLLCQRL